VRVAVIGATGVIGRSVVPTLAAAGHDVVGLARTPDKARLLRSLGGEPHHTSLADHDGLVAMFDGADAVCNFATHVPVGLSAVRPHAWRAHDRLRTEGVRRVVEAAREARVRRVVQESVSFLYADQGDGWVHEDSPVEITRATEPASVGECHVQEYTCGSRAGVVLRFGTIVGDDPTTRFQLRAVQQGHAIGLGSPDGWAHVVHTDDLGPAVLGALQVPSGTYNVGAEPVRRVQMVAGYSAAAGRDSIDFIGPFLRRMGGFRLEPLARSLRVSSDHFTAQSGWTPVRPRFDPTWFTDALPTDVLGEALR
jgi:nucleoside-diphosphate-sugar epimerase